MSSTFVITLDEDVAEFLDMKTRGGKDATAYILQILRQEKQRQEQQKAAGRPSRQ